jgi:hypothetical protein
MRCAMVGARGIGRIIRMLVEVIVENLRLPYVIVLPVI